MPLASSAQSRSNSQRGQTIVLFAIILPLILAFGSVVVTVGNWWVHKRHLQTQVDAAALAGAPSFVGCFLNPDGANGANVDIATYALKYAGDTRRDPATANLQVEEPNDVYAVLNSASYWAQANGTDPNAPSAGYGLDYSMPPVDSQGNPAPDSKPCSIKALDVKGTDDEAPTLWGWLPFVASPKTHAKVEIYKTEGLSGFLPFAVPENDPKSVFALFVDETKTNTVDSVAPLTKPVSPSTVNGEAANIWNGAAQIDLTATEEMGMIVLESRQSLTMADLAGKTLTEMCSLAGTSCFGSIRNQSPPVTNHTGVGFIFGQQGSPGNNPTATVRDAQLTNFDLTGLFGAPNPSCVTTDPDSAPYFVWNGDCQVRIRAQIDFGNVPNAPRDVRVQINGTFGNQCNGGTAQLTRQNGWWESPWITIPAGSGRNEFRLCWRAGNGLQRRDGNFNNQVIQMAFAANTDLGKSNTAYSGPMVYAAIQPGHSLAKTKRNLVVEVGLQPPLAVTNGNAPPVMLRVAGTGSLNQMLDCDPSPRQPPDEIYNGCQTPYQRNTRALACSPNPTWDPNNLPPTLDPNDPSWVDPDCIEANPGDVSALAKGLHDRLEALPTDTPPGAGCPPNLWKQYRSQGKVPDGSDPRYMELVIANYGEFNKQGISVLPITKWAGFYATGWFVTNTGPGTKGCPDNDPPPTPPYCPKSSTNPCQATDQEVQGAVWGYFITETFASGRGRPGNELCDFAELSTCIAVLTE